jgi:S-adenosylmethionine/arginine decarboxylase-like enzyme
MAKKDDELKTISEHAVDSIYYELNKNGFINFDDGHIRVSLLLCFNHLFIENYGEEKFKELDIKIKDKIKKEKEKTLN